MNVRTILKLEKMGWPEDWLSDVKQNFHPKKTGKYQIKIYTIDDLGDEPEEGILLDSTRFSTDLELSIIHHFFEGQAYVMTIAETGQEIGRGIIDGAPFDEVEPYEDEEWWWDPDEAKELIEKQKAAKSEGYVKRPKNNKVNKKEMWVVLEANNCDTEIWTSDPFSSKELAQKHLVKRYKENVDDLGKDIIEEKTCSKNKYSILTYGADYFYGVVRSINI